MTEHTEQEMRELYDLVRTSRINLQDENEANDDEFEEDDEDVDEDDDEDADDSIE